jgi:hypothetical protein
MPLLTFLLTLLLALPLAAAPAGGIFIATDTGGLNARPSYITVTPLVGGTNLNAGVLNATNDLRLNGVSIFTLFPTNGAIGNLVNTGPSVAGYIPTYTDTSGTNVTPTNAISLPTGGGATFLVAAVDATSRERAQADYQCDGVADDVQINAAITAAYPHGGIVQLSSGNFTNTSSITVTNGVILQGSGNDGYIFDLSTTRHRSRIVAGTAGMNILVGTPSTLLLGRPLIGFQLKDVEFDGMGIANYGVKLESASHPFISNVAVSYCTNACMWLGASSNPSYTGLIHTYAPVVLNTILNNRATNSGDAIRLDGDIDNAYAANGSTTLGTFINLELSHYDGTGLNIVRGDHHSFINLNITQLAGGSGNAVDCHDVAVGEHGTGYNTWLGGYTGGGQVLFRGTNTQPSIYNNWLNYSTSDLALLPVTTGAAEVFYNTLEGTNVNRNFTMYTASVRDTITATPGVSEIGLDFATATTTSGLIRTPNNTPAIVGRNALDSANVELFRINTLNELGIIAPVRFSDDLAISDAQNITVSGTTGTKIGTATTQKLGLWNATPDVQSPNTLSARAVLVRMGAQASGVTIDPTSAVAATIASAGTIAPTARITFISGAAAIDTITAPTGVASTGGTITLIATGAWTCTTAGNIASTFTAVANKAYQFAYDATTTKWYPPN